MTETRRPGVLLDAVVEVLEAEATEQDSIKRLRMLQRARSTIDGWKDQHLTTKEAIEALLALRGHGSRSP